MDRVEREVFGVLERLELKVPPLAWALSCLVSMWACKVWLPEFGIALPYALEIASGLGLLGLGVAVGGVVQFRLARTTVNPLSPSAASSLVRHGIYRYSRNPMYLGMLVSLLGWGYWLQNAVAFVFVPLFLTALTRFQIIPEERILLREFGSDYEGYLKSTARWLVV